MYLRWWSDYSKYSRILIFKSMSVISSPRICLTVEFLEWFESPIESTCEEDQLLRRPFDDSIVCCCFCCCCCCCCWRYCCCWTEGGISVRDFKQFIFSQTLSGSSNPCWMGLNTQRVHGKNCNCSIATFIAYFRRGQFPNEHRSLKKGVFHGFRHTLIAN